VTLSGLSSLTTYHFEVLSSDGILATSSDETFTTASAGGGVVVNVAAGYGGTGSSASTAPPSAVSTTTAPASSSLAIELASLEAQLASLESQAGTGTTTSAPNPTSGSSSYLFTRNLILGMTGNDVHQLQLLLIAQNAGPAVRKLAAHGSTHYFGSLTTSALSEFQKHVGITPAAGYFGPITRAYVAEHGLQ
jgi:peptidoglycan hydrolase-like protein with peptidoglycan-binding domain